MNYQDIYEGFIQSRQDRSVLPSGPVEVHHILPRSMGGDDSEGNLLPLTAREHYFAHRLLAKIHGGKMNSALAIMSKRSGKGNYVNTSRGFEKNYCVLSTRCKKKRKKKQKTSINPIKYAASLEKIELDDALSELGWSKAKLSEKIGVHKATVYEWSKSKPPSYAIAYLELALVAKRCTYLI